MANMEHIINIAVSVDDKGIENAVIEGAKKQIMSYVFPNGFIKPRANYYKDNEMSAEAYVILRSAIEDMVKENKDRIIEIVSEGIKDRLLENRTFRQKINTNIKDGEGE